MIRFAELFCRTAVQLSCAGVPPSHSGLLPAGFSLGAGEWVTCLYPSGSTWRPFRTGKLSQACPSLWVLGAGAVGLDPASPLSDNWKHSRLSPCGQMFRNGRPWRSVWFDGDTRDVRSGSLPRESRELFTPAASGNRVR